MIFCGILHFVIIFNICHILPMATYRNLGQRVLRDIGGNKLSLELWPMIQWVQASGKQISGSDYSTQVDYMRTRGVLILLKLCGMPKY